jgi:hypothetical protein
LGSAESKGQDDFSRTDLTPLARSVGSPADGEVVLTVIWPDSALQSTEETRMDDVTSFADATSCMCGEHHVVRAAIRSLDDELTTTIAMPSNDHILTAVFSDNFRVGSN